MVESLKDCKFYIVHNKKLAFREIWEKWNSIPQGILRKKPTET